MVKVVKVGFTGTREGLTPAQSVALHAFLAEFDGPAEFHHGDCLGADADAHHVAKALRFTLACHPPVDSSLRAFLQDECHILYFPEEYLARNKSIVRSTDLLVACPKGPAEELRSGTWSTVRFARSLLRPLAIIWPSGELTKENFPNA